MNKFCVIVLLCYLRFIIQTSQIKSRNGNVENPMSKRDERRIERRVNWCKRYAGRVCHNDAIKSIKTYERCWMRRVKRCLSGGGKVRKAAYCSERKFIRAARICFLNQCVRVIFPFTMCIKY